VRSRSIDVEMMMPIKYWLASLAWLSVAAAAQQPAQSPNPADAHAAVPAPRYESTFQNYRPAPEEKDTPDVAWRSLNDTVQALGGHAGHVKGSGNAMAPVPRPAMPSQQSHHEHH
jgi:hypothetical protein